MQQLGGTQVHHQRQHETPQMPELILRQFAFQRTKETLQKRRQARDHHGSALRGSGGGITTPTTQPRKAVLHAPTPKMAMSRSA
jgi:hypothetical protein